MGESRDYDDEIRAQASRANRPAQMYRAMAIEDIRRAADALRPDV